MGHDKKSIESSSKVKKANIEMRKIIQQTIGQAEYDKVQIGESRIHPIFLQKPYASVIDWGEE